MKDGRRMEEPRASPREQQEERGAVVYVGDADTSVFSSADWQAPQKGEINASGERELSLANEVHFLPGKSSE